MDLNKKNIFFFLSRLLFCLFIFGGWTFWLLKPEQKNEIKSTIKNSQNKNTETLNKIKPNIVLNKNVIPKDQVRKANNQQTKTTANKIIQKKTEIKKTNNIAAKPSTKTQIQKVTKTSSQNPSQTSKNTILKSSSQKPSTPKPSIFPSPSPSIKPSVQQQKGNTTAKPNTQPASTKAHIDAVNMDSPQEEIEVSLRKEIKINKQKIKPVLERIEDPASINLQASNPKPENTWVPKYIAERDSLKQKLEVIINNFDKIASQIEYAGTVNNNSGQISAVIKNKTTNESMILNKGEEYLGLKLVDFNNDYLILGNKNINKTYTKKLSGSTSN